MWPISVSVSVFTQPRLLTKKLTSVRSLCTFHVCPDASKKSSKMVSQPGRQLRDQDRQFGYCGRSMCAAHRRVPWCVKKSSESDSTSAPSAPGRLLQCPASGLFKRSSKCSLYALSAFWLYAGYHQYIQHKVMRFTVFVNIVLKTIQAT